MSAARKVAVLKGGGSLERTVSLRSGARAQQALSRLGHEVVAIDAGQDFVAQSMPLDRRERAGHQNTAGRSDLRNAGDMEELSPGFRFDLAP